MPAFVSRDRLCIFDASQTLLPNSSSGIAVDVAGPELVAGGGTLAGFSGFGFERGKEYEGTLFRLPLRLADDVSPWDDASNKMDAAAGVCACV